MAAPELSKYRTFLESTLYPRRDELMQILHLKKEEHAEYVLFLSIVDEHGAFEKMDYHTVLDIGKDVWMQSRARAEDIRECIFIHTGLGFHLPLPLTEAVGIAQARMALLSRRMELLNAELVQVEADVEEARGLLGELANVLAE